MKALRLHARADLRVDDVPEPGALKPNEIRLANSFCGICGTDLHEYKAGPILVPAESHPLTGAKMPQIMGHEFAGRVIEIGSAVKRLKIGDRVSVMPLLAPPGDPFVRRGEVQNSPDLAIIGLMTPWGGMAEQAVVPEENAYALPDSVSDEQGAAIEPAAVVVHAVDRGGVRAGHSVLINGAGPIGVLAAMAAKAAGATRVIVLEPNLKRCESALALGMIDVACPPDSEDARRAIAELTEDGLGVDVAIECVGHEAALATSLNFVRRGGTVVQVGLMTRPVNVDVALLVCKDIRLQASWCYPSTLWPRVIGMVASGALPVERIVSKRIDYADAVTGGFDVLLSPGSDALKILIRTAV